METFMSPFIVVFILQTFTPCLPTVQKRHSDVYIIETTIKHDINVSITPLFYKGRYSIPLSVGRIRGKVTSRKQ
jgi:hypothetical protein